MNLHNLRKHKERLEHELRVNREQRIKLQQEQHQLEEFLCLIRKRIIEILVEGEE